MVGLNGFRVAVVGGAACAEDGAGWCEWGGFGADVGAGAGAEVGAIVGAWVAAGVTGGDVTPDSTGLSSLGSFGCDPFPGVSVGEISGDAADTSIPMAAAQYRFLSPGAASTGDSSDRLLGPCSPLSMLSS